MRFCYLLLVVAPLVAPGLCSAAKPAFFDRFDYTFFEPWAVADVNGDGIPDVLGTGQGSGADGFGATVWFGNGDGTFRPGPNTQFNFFKSAEILADVNGDGKLDIVMAGSLEVHGPSSYLAVSFGNGDGTFGPLLMYPDAVNDNLRSLVIADFNQDGIPDVAAAGGEGVWVALGTGAGTFGQGTLYSVSGAQTEGLSGIVAGDFNDDGKIGLAELTNTGFAVLVGNGNGTFQPAVSTLSTYSKAPTTFSAGDLNGDGYTDIVLTNDSQQYVQVYLGKGAGIFDAPTYANLPTNLSVAIGDVNGDGFPDLVSSSVYIAFGDGKGKFRAPVSYSVAGGGSGGGGVLQDVFLSDLRNNGRLDILAVGTIGTTSVLLSLGKGVFNDGIWVPVAGGGAGCMAAGDFNGDGHLDVAFAATEGISVMLGTGSAKTLFTQGEILSIPYFATCPTSADVNGDGIPDLLVVTSPPSTDGELMAYLGKGDGTFTPGPSVALSKVGQIATGDFNGDGKQDVVTSANQLALGNGDGTFQPPKPFVPYILAATQATGFSDIAAGDLNGDGKPDVVLTDGIHSYLYVLINNGKGGWTESIYGTCSEGYIPVIGDLNGDHLPDILVGTSIGSGCIYSNLGGGKFAYTITLTVTVTSGGALPWIADVNGDGVPDILLQESSDVAVLLGQGSGHFATPFYLGTGSPGGILTGNFHGQSPIGGTPDIIVPFAGGAVDVILNLTP